MHSTVKMITAAEIKEARKAVGESQTDFCARLGIDQSTLSRWEEKGPPDHGPTQIAIAGVISRILRDTRAEVTDEAAALIGDE